MTALRYFQWFFGTALCFAAISALQHPVRKRSGVPLRVLLLILKLLLCLALAYAVMAVNTGFVFRFAFVLSALYIALFGDLLGDLFTLPALIRKKDRATVHILVGAVCTLLYLIAGTVNMQAVSANHLTFTSPKLRDTYRFVFLADLHVGSSQSMKTTEATIQKVMDEQPDFVVLGGDITDEFTTREEMEQTFRLLGQLRVPVYFIYGNHDRQPDYAIAGGYTYAPEELDAAIRGNGIEIIKDQWISISEDLVLFGREDYSSPERQPLETLPQRPDHAFVLLIDHSPYQTEDIVASGADLQLSGHTHAGQFFPLQALYRLTGHDAYGSFRHGQTDLYVSSGASGWYVPFRTEEACHYEVVTLSPAE